MTVQPYQKEILDALEHMRKSIENILWMFKVKHEHFYFKSKAMKFYNNKMKVLDRLLSEGKIKSYNIGVNLLEWPYRVVWSKKIKGDIQTPSSLIMRWRGMEIEKIRNM